MQNLSYCAWHYGDFEIFHTMNVHLKREERGYGYRNAESRKAFRNSNEIRRYTCMEGQKLFLEAQ